MELELFTTREILKYAFAALMIVSAVMTITHRNPLKAALFLVVSFFALSGIYLILGAQFIAAIQILVYAGAIMVLVLFVIMLLNLGDDQLLLKKLRYKHVVAGLVTGAILFQIVLVLTWSSSFLQPKADPATIAEIGTVESIGRSLYTHYVLAFEIVALLLLATIIGAVLLAKKKAD